MIRRGCERERARDVDPLALAARELVRIALGEAARIEPDAGEEVAGAALRLALRRAVHARAEGDRGLDRQARIERRVAVLEHHLDLAAKLSQRQRAGAERLAVEQHLAGVGPDEVHEQARGGRLAAAGLADDAERLALQHVEIDAVDGAHQRRRAEHALPDREMLDEPAHRQQRLRRPAAVRGGGHGRVHCFTSIAERSPSESRLNEIEVMKIMAPGSAATQGWT